QWYALQADALVTVGTLIARSGELRTAVQLLEQAVRIALHEGRDDIAVHGIVSLTDVTGASLAEVERGPWWGELGMALSGRAPQQLPQLHMSIALVEAAAGRLAQAQQSFEQARALIEERFGPDHPELAIALAELAAVYRERGDLGGARSLYERALT